MGQVGPSNISPCVETEFKKEMKPILWLTPEFPLKTEELLPLLDILANKVKAVRRLRELFTTKLPPGTFPVKVSFLRKLHEVFYRTHELLLLDRLVGTMVCS